MNAVLRYFTGTGNTRHAVGIVADILAASGWTTDVREIPAGGGGEDLGRPELLLIAFPILGFAPPSTMLRYLKRLPRVGAGRRPAGRRPAGQAEPGRASGLRTALLGVCGSFESGGKVVKGWSGAALWMAGRILRRRGYEIVAVSDLSYPENWTQISNPPSAASAERLFAAADPECADFGRALAAGKSRLHWHRGPLEWLAEMVAPLYVHFGRRVIGMVYVADASCNGCGMCERICPARIIRMRRERPCWGIDCSGCQRCINACPSRSIQVSSVKLVLQFGLNIAAVFIAIALAPLPLRALGLGVEGLAGALLSVVSALAIFAAITALQIGPLDALLNLAGRSRLLGGIVSANYTKAFRRYLAPGYKPGTGK
jgi:NAD-dependent dihydropyrimidine dehydrogenase PreA subunit